MSPPTAALAARLIGGENATDATPTPIRAYLPRSGRRAPIGLPLFWSGGTQGTRAGNRGRVLLRLRWARSIGLLFGLLPQVIGTALFIMAAGLYPLFIEKVAFVGWPKIETTDEQETNLIGVAIVVLAVNFMGAIITRNSGDMLGSGAGIALPIAALGLFIGLRAWADRNAGTDGIRDAERPSDEGQGGDARGRNGAQRSASLRWCGGKSCSQQT